MDTVHRDPRLDLMAEIAQPLDDWCELCSHKLAVARTQDGVAACNDCMNEVMAALAKYKADAAFAAAGKQPSQPNRKQRRARAKAARKSRKRNRR